MSETIMETLFALMQHYDTEEIMTSLKYLFVILIIFTSFVSAEDWTTWKGPNGDYTTNESGWNAEALSDYYKVLRKTNLGKGHASGFGRIKNKTPLQCVDLKTGELKWRQEIGKRYGACMMADGKLIILSSEGELIIADVFSDGYNVISSTQVLYMENNAGIPEHQQCACWTVPLLANSQDNYGNMVCIDAD